MSGFFFEKSSDSHLLRAACFEAGLPIFATSNLFLTTLFCSSVLLYIEPSIINELNLSLCSEAKCLAMRAPNEKPTK